MLRAYAGDRIVVGAGSVVVTATATTVTGDLYVTGTLYPSATGIALGDNEELYLGSGSEYWWVYNKTGTQLELWGTNVDGSLTDGLIMSVDDGTDDVDFTGGIVVGETATITGVLSVDDTTDTSSGTTGSIHTDGGLGVAKKLYVGTTSALTGNVGIGVAPAANALKVTEADANQAAMAVFHTDATDPVGLYMQFSGGAPNNQTDYFARFLDNAATRAYIWSDGSFQGQDGIFAGDLTVSGTGPHAIGGGTDGHQALRIVGAFTSDGGSNNSTGTLFDQQITGANGDTSYQVGVYCQSDITTQSNSETVADVAQLRLDEPNITIGTDTITNASTLLITGAPTEGASNYAILVDSGVFRNADSTDTTSATTGAIQTAGGIGCAKNLFVGVRAGIGVAASANADLVLEAGRLMLKESATPTADAGYGKLYTKSDNKLYFQDGAGTETTIATTGTTVTFKDYSVSDFGNAGTHYIGGFYEAPAAHVVLTIGGTVTQTYGTAGRMKAAHAFAVASGAGGTDLVLTVTGISITDAGVRNDADSEILVADADAATTDQYFETTKKWLGQVTYTLTGAAGAFTFNYGFAKYDDFGNRDFIITDFEAVIQGSASETGFDIELLKHTTTGWTYSAAAFTPGNNTICSSLTDFSATNDNTVADEYFAYKRTGLNTSVSGSGVEGILMKAITAVNNSVRYGDIHVGVTL
jgi:hypothetical protein